jgi:lantibiotic modifying enzyme
MKTFTLGGVNKSKKFIFHSSSASIKVGKVSLLLENDSNAEWTSLISKLKLKAELRHTVNQENDILDNRMEEFPIHLLIDPYQNQPVFILNQTIESKKIKIGLSDKEHFYTDLIFELEDSGNNGEPWSLLFEYEMSDMDEK